MNQEKKPFEFSELVMLYCKNWDIVKTLEQHWKAESDELVRRLKERITEYEDQWNIYFSNTYGWAIKKTWEKAGSSIKYGFFFDPGMIGKGRIWASIQVKGRELRKKVCGELGKKIKETFGQEVNSRNEYISYLDKEVGNKNYEDAIVKIVQLCIDFSPNLDPYVEV
jgi:hypothetical protein